MAKFVVYLPLQYAIRNNEYVLLMLLQAFCRNSDLRKHMETHQISNNDKVIPKLNLLPSVHYLILDSVFKGKRLRICAWCVRQNVVRLEGMLGRLGTDRSKM